jgi:aminotransferase in exopolysaccharide biosynthesis
VKADILLFSKFRVDKRVNASILSVFHMNTKNLIHFIRAEYGTDDFIPLHVPRFSAEETRRVMETLEAEFVSSVGVHVREFEERMEAYTGARHAIGVVNGTAALHTCLRLAGLEPGDEVITQSLTFVATCNAISYQFAHPVFVDVERATLGMCPDALNAFLEESAEIDIDGNCRNRHTGAIIRACVPMHTFGHPVRMNEIAAVCDEYGIMLIEDAAESLGSFYKGRHTGNTGRLAALSFNGNKIITTGGGGMVLTNDETLAKRAKHITTTAKKPHAYLYDHDEVGYNYRLPALNAALGCAQMEALPRFVKEKRERATRYAEWFAGQDREFITEPADCASNYWLNAFLCEDRTERDRVLEETNGAGVMTRPIWTPMHRLPLFRDCPHGPLEQTEWLEGRVVNIPSSCRKTNPR